MNDTGPDRTERELAEALAALAEGIQGAPDAYRTARGEWLRRERRRRFVLAVVVAVVFALATLIGLWVLNRAPSHSGVIFTGTGPAGPRIAHTPGNNLVDHSATNGQIVVW